MNKYMIINHQNNILHILVSVMSLLKHTDLNITDFFAKNPIIFHEYCAFSDLSQDPSDKIAHYKIWNYSLGSTLQFALFKIKIRILESDEKCLRHGSCTKPHLSLCKRDTTKKNAFLEI